MDAAFSKSGLVRVVFVLTTMVASSAAHAQSRPGEMLRDSGAMIVDFATSSIAWRYIDGVNARQAIRFVVDEEFVGEATAVPYRSTTSTGRPEPFALRLLSTRFSLSNGSLLRLGSGRRRGASFSVELTY